MSNVLTKFEQEFGLAVNEEGKIVTSSIRVAEYYGKEHADVMKKIRGFIKLIPELGNGNFSETIYIDEHNRRQPMFKMDRQGFSMLVNKFTGDDATIFTYRYTKAFEEMTEELADKREYIQSIADKVKADKVLTFDDLNKMRFSEKRTIKTFASADMKIIDELVRDFNEYVSTLDTATRIARCKSAIDGINRLHDRLALDGVHNIGNCYNLKQLIIEIKDYRHKIENKRNGGQKAAQTKRINNLEQKLSEIDDTYIPDDTNGIYSIQCLANDKRYIGRSMDIARRFTQHMAALEDGTHWIESMQNDWDRYGEGRFKFEVIEETEDLELEAYYIKHYNSTDEIYGYNTYRGGKW